jgi:Uma2 family endonuclease
MATTKLWTVEDLDRLDPDHIYELIDGELIEVPVSGFGHTAIGMWLGSLISAHVATHHLGAVMGSDGAVILQRDPDTMLIPDIGFVRRDRLPRRDAWTPRLAQAPDLAVEILSPSNRPDHIARKVGRYLVAGVMLVWIVDPDEETVTIYRIGGEREILNRADELSGENVLPGFHIPAAMIFNPFGVDSD